MDVTEQGECNLSVSDMLKRYMHSSLNIDPGVSNSLDAGRLSMLERGVNMHC